MELRHLRHYVAMAEELNVRQAATRLYLSGRKHLYPFAILLRGLPAERLWLENETVYNLSEIDNGAHLSETWV